MKKYYCYVDETGQDTKGELFLVSIVLQRGEKLEKLEQQLLQIEIASGKHFLKWKSTSKKIRLKYLQALLSLKEIRGSIFYSTYHKTKEYSKLIALSIAKAVLAKSKEDDVVNVIIDGLNRKERDIIRFELKKLKIRYKRIRGMKDEQNVFLRLADTMAGLLRASEEKQTYIQTIMGNFRKGAIITEV